MTINGRKPVAEVLPCHATADDSRQQNESIGAQPRHHNEGISIAWPPSKRHLAIGGGIAALIVLAAAVFVFNVSPGNLALFALVLACPLMHVFMMRGMGHGGQNGNCHGSQQGGGQTSVPRKEDKA
ncbi:MAG: DUF2933 domain-containing protein [Chloroflexota bacterium]|nr:MAG: DUF2933 domain-containing protein [Chloroflexota bacterium]